MNKKIGEQLDVDIHLEMLSSFTKFIETFSPLLDIAEIYKKNIVAENLINPNEDNLTKLQLINETVEILNNMVPTFFKFAKLEDQLEKFHK